MSDDRMERVKEKARESAPDYFPSHDQFGFAVEGASDGQRGYLDGAVFGAEMFRTLTDAEWEQTREDVDRAVWDGELPMADAAMRAVGLRREGE